MKILVINGPNIDMLGIREPDIYGKKTYRDLMAYIEREAAERDVDVEFYQSNHEGDLVDKIHYAYFHHYDGIVINPAAYTHTSVALLDAVKAVMIPTVEVHISDVPSREDFRQVSYIRKACIATITGRGFKGYADAMDVIIGHVSSDKDPDADKEKN
ncbi:MAG: type II 3-dehydroquinate dehydratase [Anaerovoracaceae bacterium]